MLTDRQETLLDAIVREYIKTAEPVASLKLSGFSVSPATIRNDMATLEEDGYLTQPHVSAGRIPTEKGFRFYIERLENTNARREEKNTREMNEIHALRREGDQYLKELAKHIAELTREAVLVGFGPHDVYYTGLSHLLAKPEFHEHPQLAVLTDILDHLDDVMVRVFRDVGNNVEILLGAENPFGEQCGAILIKVHYGRRSSGVLGVLGPMRMDYDRNIALMRSIASMLAH